MKLGQEVLSDCPVLWKQIGCPVRLKESWKDFKKWSHTTFKATAVNTAVCWCSLIQIVWGGLSQARSVSASSSSCVFFSFFPFIHLMSFSRSLPSPLPFPITSLTYFTERDVQTSKTPLCIWFDLNLSLGKKSGRCHNESVVIHLLELIGQLYNFLNRHRSRSHRYLTQIWGDQNVFLPFLSLTASMCRLAGCLQDWQAWIQSQQNTVAWWFSSFFQEPEGSLPENQATVWCLRTAHVAP